MSQKKKKYLQKKSSKLMTAAKICTLLLSAFFSGAMTALSGAGLVYNRGSYGESLADTGFFLIISAALMVSGAVLCLFRKNLPDILSIILSFAGLVLCMVMLKKLTGHADASGWTDKYTLEPVSGMYIRRILPCIVPVLMSGAIAAVQLGSYELKEQRRAKKAEKNAPAPPIIDEE
ncbi:MAG: hypothetical protein IKW96_01750 [Ruminococcus sp.]|uniref:hypothetical protein n=1 Tax=Ruminococcus sp. TaxID=41978 RepID=UPI0025CCADAF|nr:hypothetical protein [Ruminococcus sp.]MBR5681992.1 hypothetical protein [Ruminococcus sp.]